MMLTQTVHPTFDDLGLVEAHHKLLSVNITWSEVGIFVDEEIGKQHSVITVLLENEVIAAVFRVCLDTPEETVEAINLFVSQREYVTYRSYQGGYFSLDEIRSLAELNKLWSIAHSQSVTLKSSDLVEIYRKIFSESRERGRGKDFSEATKRQVNMDAHGRCMFRGCGVDLGIDELTGKSGNYGYLAHNVASSESGPRGVPRMSEEFSNDPSNILLFCDKHHRLVDKIAVVDYPAHELSKMRSEFSTTVSRLLNALSYDPVPAIAVLWPVQRNVISAPSNFQINQCLARSRWRSGSELFVPSSDNDAIFRDHSPCLIKTLWPELINKASKKVISCLGYNQYRAALFAFGPMPQLIALGAKIGNKQEIIPMLRYRDGNQWVWPDDNPRGTCYDIVGMSELGSNEDEIIMTLSLTNKPPQFDAFTAKKNLKKVEILARHDFLGNGAIGHPQDGIDFMADMQRLLHKLKDTYGVNKVHLLPCASNAACLFFGKAFDVHHPDLIAYDFSGNTMEPILRITNQDTKCEIELAH